MGLSCGNIVLTIAVLSIIITAPLGAFGIDMTYRKLLKAEPLNDPDKLSIPTDDVEETI